MNTNRIDWAAEESAAALLSESQINDKLAGLIDALDAADALDRETGQDRGGYYRDLCSILRQELARRVKKGLCRCCGK